MASEGVIGLSHRSAPLHPPTLLFFSTCFLRSSGVARRAGQKCVVLKRFFPKGSTMTIQADATSGSDTSVIAPFFLVSKTPRGGQTEGAWYLVHPPYERGSGEPLALRAARYSVLG